MSKKRRKHPAVAVNPTMKYAGTPSTMTSTAKIGRLTKSCERCGRRAEGREEGCRGWPAAGARDDGAGTGLAALHQAVYMHSLLPHLRHGVHPPRVEVVAPLLPQHRPLRQCQVHRRHRQHQHKAQHPEEHAHRVDCAVERGRQLPEDGPRNERHDQRQRPPHNRGGPIAAPLQRDGAREAGAQQHVPGGTKLGGEQLGVVLVKGDWLLVVNRLLYGRRGVCSVCISWGIAGRVVRCKAPAAG